MNIIGINTLVYMDALRDGATQSELLGSIAELGVTLAEVRREYIAGDDEFNAIANAARINGLRLFYSVPESITVNGDVNPRFEEFLDEAQRMGASNVKFNQGDINNVDLEVLRRIDESSAAHGVTLTIEMIRRRKTVPSHVPAHHLTISSPMVARWATPSIWATGIGATKMPSEPSTGCCPTSPSSI